MSEETQPSHGPPGPKRNIYQRLLGVMQDVPYVQKTGTAPREVGGFTYVKHDDVVGALRPALVKHGVYLHANVLEHDLQVHDKVQYFKDGGKKVGHTFFTTCHLELRAVNVDNPEEYVSMRVWGYGIDSQDKGPGKAITYAYKTGVLKLFNLETGDDEENERFGESGNGFQNERNGNQKQVPPSNGEVQTNGAGQSKNPIDERKWARFLDCAKVAESMGGKDAVMDWLRENGYESLAKTPIEALDDCEAAMRLSARDARKFQDSRESNEPEPPKPEPVVSGTGTKRRAFI